MEQDITSRVEHLLSELNLNASAFADGILIPRAVMSHILSRRNKTSLDVVQKILKKFPQISTDWLINGIGNMIQLNIFEDDKYQPSPHETNAMKAVPTNKETSATSKIVAADAPAMPLATTEVTPEVAVPDPSPSEPPPVATPTDAVLPPAIQDKKIEKIVFFYTDKSFSVHFPE